ncbi:MAG: hypothetical protein MUE30_19960 [Spirosomaceae bacterium]|jgi:hypothetical protein|nr:hypothetical protein [Spirosomataceae bacterium]
MAFRKLREIGDVLTKYDLRFRLQDFVEAVLPYSVGDTFKQDLAFVQENFPYKASEAAICEMIIFPILKEVWRVYRQNLMLWSHRSIQFDKELKGIPDYIIAKQSERGPVVFEMPLLAVVEAKQDDFVEGWAQCALEMYTIQQINGRQDLKVYGIVSNGDNWEFGYLETKTFYQHTNSFSLSNLEQLFAALDFVMRSCVLTSQNYEK